MRVAPVRFDFVLAVADLNGDGRDETSWREGARSTASMERPRTDS